MEKKQKLSPVKMVVVIAIGAALYGLGGLIGIPVFANTTLKPAMAVLAVFAAMYGPIVGFLVGFLGHMLTDLLAGWGVWVSWALGSGLVGLIMSTYIYITKSNLEKGIFRGREVGIFIGMSFVANFLGYMVSAIIDVIMYAEPFGKVIVQQLIVSVANTVVIGTIGVLLMYLIAKRNAQKQNLSLED